MDKFVSAWKEQQATTGEDRFHSSGNQSNLNGPLNRPTIRRSRNISNYFQPSADSNHSTSSQSTLSQTSERENISLNVSGSRQSTEIESESKSQSPPNSDAIEPIQDDDSTIVHRNKRRKLNSQSLLEPFLEKQPKPKLNGVLSVPPLINNGYSPIYRETGLHCNRIMARNRCNVSCATLSRLMHYNIWKSDNFFTLPIVETLQSRFQQSGHAAVLPDYISTIRFDPMGSLFVVASTSGDIRVYDFDTFFSRWNTGFRLQYANICAKDATTQHATRSAMPIQPLASLNPNCRAEDVAWNPHNDEQLAVAGASRGAISIYDLASLTNRPCQVLEPAPSNTHKSPIIQLYFRPKHSAHPSKMLYGCDRMGRIFGWDTKSARGRHPVLSVDNSAHNCSGFAVGRNPVYNQRRNQSTKYSPVKAMAFGDDGVVMHTVRENGQIQLYDIRFSNRILKTVDLWKCPLLSSSSSSSSQPSNNSDESASPSSDSQSRSQSPEMPQLLNNTLSLGFTNAQHNRALNGSRARVDDAIFLTTQHTAIVRLQNCTLLNINFGTETIVKAYSTPPKPNDTIDPSFLGKATKRRMCGIPTGDQTTDAMVLSASVGNELMAVDMSTQLDVYWREKYHRSQRHKLGLPLNASALSKGSFASAKAKAAMGNENSYGLMGSVALSDVVTCCDVNPYTPFILCGTLSNRMEMLSLSSWLNEDDISGEYDIIKNRQPQSQRTTSDTPPFAAN